MLATDVPIAPPSLPYESTSSFEGLWIPAVLVIAVAGVGLMSQFVKSKDGRQQTSATGRRIALVLWLVLMGFPLWMDAAVDPCRWDVYNYIGPAMFYGWLLSLGASLVSLALWIGLQITGRRMPARSFGRAALFFGSGFVVVSVSNQTASPTLCY